MTIDTKQLIYILDNTPPEQNIMLVGKHGIGKSRILEDYYKEKGAKVVTLFLGQMSDPGDLIGLPEKNAKTGKTDFMLPYWFPLDDEPVVLFLDELNRARPEVLQTIMDLTLNRKLAGKNLPKGSRIISAVNDGNEYQLTDLDPALVSRFNIYTFEPSVEDWLLWAEQNHLDERIIAFISENPEMLDSSDFEYEKGNLDRSPDRRSWERVSKIICNFKELGKTQMPIVSGIIGNRATSLFFRFVNEHNLPSAKELLCNSFLNVVNLDGLLKNLSSVDFSQLNNSIFRFIESENYNEDEKKIIADNLSLYFDYLTDSAKKEVQAHFLSLCSAESFPNTLVFISTECSDLYEKIMQSIMSI